MPTRVVMHKGPTAYRTFSSEINIRSPVSQEWGLYYTGGWKSLNSGTIILSFTQEVRFDALQPLGKVPSALAEF